jgi:hypothetical protein
MTFHLDGGHNMFKKLNEWINPFYKEGSIFRRSGKGRYEFLTEKQIESEKYTMRIRKIRERLSKFEEEYTCFLNDHCDERIDNKLHYVKPISIDKRKYAIRPGCTSTFECLGFRAQCIFCGNGVSFDAPEVTDSLDDDKKYFEEWFKSEGYDVKTDEGNSND